MPKFNTTRKLTGTTCTWLAMIALCLQPNSMGGSGCGCDDKAQSSPQQATCCSAKSDLSTCCSTRESNTTCLPTKPATSGCCCDPTNDVCLCEDCDCCVKDESPAPPLTIPPANPPTDVQIQISLFSFPFETLPLKTESDRVSTHTANDSDALSAQQTCILLSRFTC